MWNEQQTNIQCAYVSYLSALKLIQPHLQIDINTRKIQLDLVKNT